MHRICKLHPALAAGWICVAASFFPWVACATAPVVGSSDDPAQLLARADSIKSAKHDEFLELLQRLDADPSKLSASQQMQLRYLKAWQTAYTGDYTAALPQLNAIIVDARDVNLRARAQATSINLLTNATRYENAYAQLNDVLAMLPQVSDPIARQQIFFIAANQYTEAGQYDLALAYAQRVLAETPKSSTGAICKGQSIIVEATYRSAKSALDNSEATQAVRNCEEAGEKVFANSIRMFIARMDLDRNRPDDAIKLLGGSYDETRKTQYPEAIARTDAMLAQAYWKSGDIDQASHYAQRAVNGGIRNEYTEALVNAYQVLYEVAKQKGDTTTALAWHEKYTAADKGHLSDTSARTLAYQMVKQQVREKKLQVDTLNKRNQVLLLKQQVGAKAAEAGKLLTLLLLTVLGSIVLYSWRTKRSQLKFQKLAQRDGLTGIFNRQHFIEASEHALDYAAKSVRDVCAILIDLDHFKEVNDTHGHAAGDAVLRRAVGACEQHLRSLDVFGRIGGEEFGILLPDCVPERAADVAEAMRKSIADLCELETDRIDFPVSASFGIAAARWSGYDLRQLLAHADSALYQAKREGRNRVAVFDNKAGGNN